MRGQYDDALEAQIDLRPSNPEARRLVEAAVRMSMKFPNPNLGDIVKAVGTVGGWLWQPRKGERAQDFLLGLYERLERTRSEYLKKEEAEDLFEDVIRRVSEQPDADRRTKLGAIFGRVAEEPREHVQNRLLLRLADELPVDALRFLAVVYTPLTQVEVDRTVGTEIIAERIGIDSVSAKQLASYLNKENLVADEDRAFFRPAGPEGADLTYLLTPLGRLFVTYSRG